MPKEMSGLERHVTALFGKTYGRAHAVLYRLSSGKLGSRFLGAPVMVVTTTGRKSGRARSTPLLYLRDGDCLITVASKGGFPTHPAWYLNLCAQPVVEVQVGGETRTLTARTATEQEKARYWPQLVAMYPPYQGYQDKTGRSIPVVILS
jgi:deazaflavin-dependent oxidoreductase (nitroreductase family)